MKMNRKRKSVQYTAAAHHRPNTIKYPVGQGNAGVFWFIITMVMLFCFWKPILWTIVVVVGSLSGL